MRTAIDRRWIRSRRASTVSVLGSAGDQAKPRKNVPRRGALRQVQCLAMTTPKHMIQDLLKAWMREPVHFVGEAIGVEPDPWQCDVLDAVVEHDNVAIRAAHGVGKTALLSWVAVWFVMTRPLAKVPTTAPTFNKQVRDVLWAEVHRTLRLLRSRLPLLADSFEVHATRLRERDHPQEWFAVGVPSNEPLHIEGYHAPHLLAVFDEAKGIARPTWDAVQGMRTTHEAKLIVAS